jgi:predicted DNA-binding transcriptional regulator AlpA
VERRAGNRSTRRNGGGEAIEALLDVAQVAEILRCSRAQVYAMVAEGSLSKVPLPYRATRFTRESLERLIRGEVA